MFESAMEMASKGRDLVLVVGAGLGLLMAAWRLILADRKDRRDRETHEAERKARENESFLKAQESFGERVRQALDDSGRGRASAVLREFALRDMAWKALITNEPLGKIFREEAIAALEAILERESAGGSGRPETEENLLTVARQYRKILKEAAKKAGD